MVSRSWYLPYGCGPDHTVRYLIRAAEPSKGKKPTILSIVGNEEKRLYS
jgi:hypothetical protein